MPWADPQIEPVGINEWLCNTCSRVFRVSRQSIPLGDLTSSQGDGDDGMSDLGFTEEDLRAMGQGPFGIVYSSKRRPPR